MLSNTAFEKLNKLISEGKPNYQKLVIIITTNLGFEFECDHMIDTLDANTIDSISDELIKYCIQHYSVEYEAHYIDQTAKRIELHIHKEDNPDMYNKHGQWKLVRTGKWIWNYYFVCSECHKNTPDKAYTIAPDFCPSCGANMIMSKLEE